MAGKVSTGLRVILIPILTTKGPSRLIKQKTKRGGTSMKKHALLVVRWLFTMGADCIYSEPIPGNLQR
jgi:hypothetical protein